MNTSGSSGISTILFVGSVSVYKRRCEGFGVTRRALGDVEDDREATHGGGTHGMQHQQPRKVGESWVRPDEDQREYEDLADQMRPHIN